MAKSLMCGNFIEAAHYFEQMAAFDLFGDRAGAFSAQESLSASIAACLSSIITAFL